MIVFINKNNKKKNKATEVLQRENNYKSFVKNIDAMT
jgi:hypothetical protein